MSNRKTPKRSTNRVAKKHQKDWCPNPLSQVILRDAIALGKAVYKAEASQDLKHELLNTLVWNVTVSDGKYNTRFVSVKAMSAVEDLRHDHVFTRAYLLREILANPDSIESLMTQAVGCVVTDAEHRQLSLNEVRNLEGWDRYTHCGIRVFDRQKGIHHC